jgi:hypothetical protein
MKTLSLRFFEKKMAPDDNHLWRKNDAINVKIVILRKTKF